MNALYTTYRPRTFEEVVGQKPIVSTLEHAITSKKIGHAYLFCGTRHGQNYLRAPLRKSAALRERVRQSAVLQLRSVRKHCTLCAP